MNYPIGVEPLNSTPAPPFEAVFPQDLVYEGERAALAEFNEECEADLRENAAIEYSNATKE